MLVSLDLDFPSLGHPPETKSLPGAAPNGADRKNPPQTKGRLAQQDKGLCMRYFVSYLFLGVVSQNTGTPQEWWFAWWFPFDTSKKGVFPGKDRPVSFYLLEHPANSAGIILMTWSICLFYEFCVLFLDENPHTKRSSETGPRLRQNTQAMSLRVIIQRPSDWFGAQWFGGQGVAPFTRHKKSAKGSDPNQRH